MPHSACHYLPIELVRSLREEPRPPGAPLTVPQGRTTTAYCVVVTEAQHSCEAALLLRLGNTVRGERLVKEDF